MNAVGIDVSKGRSTVAVSQPGGVTVAKPFVVRHTKKGIGDFVNYLNTLSGDTRIVMEHTGRYYEPMAQWLSGAGLYVCAVNPLLIKHFSNNSLRKVKTDKADAKKIARYALDNWCGLRQYTAMDKTRTELKTMNRQFGFYTKQKTAYKNNLVALIDQTYPDANRLFASPARPDVSSSRASALSSRIVVKVSAFGAASSSSAMALKPRKSPHPRRAPGKLLKPLR